MSLPNNPHTVYCMAGSIANNEFSIMGSYTVIMYLSSIINSGLFQTGIFCRLFCTMRLGLWYDMDIVYTSISMSSSFNFCFAFIWGFFCLFCICLEIDYSNYVFMLVMPHFIYLFLLLFILNLLLMPNLSGIHLSRLLWI